MAIQPLARTERPRIAVPVQSSPSQCASSRRPRFAAKPISLCAAFGFGCGSAGWPRRSAMATKPRRQRSFLITGGAGFIGSHLSERLIADGSPVTILDDLSTGFEENVPSEATLIRGDIADGDVVARAFDAAEPTHVIHLAAQVSNILSHEDPLADTRTNVGGTINVLSEMERRRVRRIFFASSMALYGSPGGAPVSEQAATDPLSPYGVSKLAAEQLVHNAARRTDAVVEQAASLRMFNVYGPRQSLSNPYQGVVSVFIADALAEQDLKLYGDGEQSRDFVYIDDVVAAWIALLDSDLTGVRINIGTGAATSVNRLLDVVLAKFNLTQETATVTHLPTLPGDQRCVRADPSLARKLLGWEALTSLEAGIGKTIEWASQAWVDGDS